MKQFLNKNTAGVIVIIVIAFCVGRYTSPEKIKTETKIVEVEKEVNKKQKQVVKIKENTDGSKETVIVTDTETDEKVTAHSETQTKEVTNPRKVNVSILAGTSLPINMVLGVNVSKPILGPITAGVWALNNKTAGLSLGFNF